MSMVSEYWAAVNDEARKIPASIAQQLNQPKGGSVYIISVKNRLQNTQAGKISECVLRLAAQRLVDGGHRLCTDAEIVDHLAGEKQRGQNEAKREIARRQNLILQVPAAQ